MEQSSPDGAIIFFDGVCHLCNGFVNFVIDRDPGHQFRFAPIQGASFKRIMQDKPGVPAGVDTIFLLQNGRIHQRSGAVLRVLRGLRFPWPLLTLGLVIPPMIRNRIYNFVAAHRYAWFGRDEVCRMPTAGQKALFLD